MRTTPFIRALAYKRYACTPSEATQASLSKLAPRSGGLPPLEPTSPRVFDRTQETLDNVQRLATELAIPQPFIQTHTRAFAENISALAQLRASRPKRAYITQVFSHLGTMDPKALGGVLRALATAKSEAHLLVMTRVAWSLGRSSGPETSIEDFERVVGLISLARLSGANAALQIHASAPLARLDKLLRAARLSELSTEPAEQIAAALSADDSERVAISSTVNLVRNAKDVPAALSPSANGILKGCDAQTPDLKHLLERALAQLWPPSGNGLPALKQAFLALPQTRAYGALIESLPVFGENTPKRWTLALEQLSSILPNLKNDTLLAPLGCALSAHKLNKPGIDRLLLALSTNGDAQIAKVAAKFSAAINDHENDPAIAIIKRNFAQDIQNNLETLTRAAPQGVPQDALPRLLSIGVGLKTLEALFERGRRKDDRRALRSLLLIADESGANAKKLAEALLSARLPNPSLMRLVRGLLNESEAQRVEPALFLEATEGLKNAAAYAKHFSKTRQAAMLEGLGLGALLGTGVPSATEKGLKDVRGPLARFFSDGAGKDQVDQNLLRQLLIATLEERVDRFRFTTPATKRHLSVLTPAARHRWTTPQKMLHIRFKKDGEKRFHQKVERAAKLGEALYARLTERFGEGLEAKHQSLVKRLRKTRKGSPAHAALVGELRGVPSRVALLSFARSLSLMTPSTITPERFLELAQKLDSLPLDETARFALLEALRLDDIDYRQVQSDDGPDLNTMIKLATTDCLRWPGNGGEALAYAVDPNKRMIVTRDERGAPRRAILRLVERQAPHEGEPLLLLERAYPRHTTREEKRRLIEHTVRRASAMGCAAAFATEYYWDASKTMRFRGDAEHDMNAVLTELCDRYQCRAKISNLRLLTRAGNTKEEYLDSDPGQLENRGRLSIRRWRDHHPNDTRIFENEFVLIEPHEDQRGGESEM